MSDPNPVYVARSEPLSQEQANEIAKYRKAYRDPFYRMGDERLSAVHACLERLLTSQATLLDVGTGRGECLDLALEVGFAEVYGTETVPDLIAARPGVVREAIAWALPFEAKSFDVVTCFDVLEHLLPRDAEPSVREFARVARSRIALTISNLPSPVPGVGELHVNRRPYVDWDRDLRAWLPGWRVEWRRDSATRVSEMWEATREVSLSPAKEI